jgi:hypothetical protein
MKKIKKITFVLPFDYMNTKEIFDFSDKKGAIEIISPIHIKEIKSSSTVKQTILTKENYLSYFNNAIIVASGYWIVFLKANTNSEEINQILRTVRSEPQAIAIVGNTSSNLINKIGVRTITNTKPVIFNRLFLAQRLPVEERQILDDFLIKNISHCDKLGSIIFDRNFINKNYYFNKNTRIFRPYFHILRKKFFAYYDSFKNWTEQKHSEYKKYRLKRKTPDLHFNYNIPVFINTRDRLEPLKKLTKWLEEEGMKNIIIIDNQSSYPPLISYLKNSRHKVLWLGQNIGHKAPWDSGAINFYAKNTPYIVTDPDVIPESASHGAIKHFIQILNKYKEYNKVGFGLRIDNIPDCYELKDKVIQWESKFWEDPVERNLYDALLDTTFALYRPNTPYTIENALRTGGKYVAEHEPWYADSSAPSDEVKYYRAHANKNSGTWGLTTNDTAEMYI